MRRATFLLAVLLAACSTTTDDAAGASGPMAGQTSDAPAVRRLLPDSEDFVLSNGLRVFLVEDHEAPLVNAAIRVAGGSVEDPAGKEGAADLLATLLGKGAGSRDAEAFHEAVDFVGGEFGSAAARRWISVEAEFLKADVPLMFELLADALQRPKLDAGEFERERGLAVDGIRQAKQDPRDIIRLYHANWFFAAHPYARPSTGDETSLASLTLDDVKAAASRLLAPSRTWMAVSGDFEPASMRKLIEERFGGWKRDTSEPVAIPAVTAPKDRGVLLIDFPSSLQTYFRFGQAGFDWKDKDYAARYVANTILGGRFTSRLNQSLRTDSGLTYGASSRFDDDAQGAFFVATYAAVDRSERAIRMAADVTSKFMSQGMTAAEFESARTYIRGQYAPNTVETAAQSAAMILALEFDGVPRAVVDGLFAKLDALTLDGVNRVVKERFPSQDWVWTVIGPASGIGHEVPEDSSGPQQTLRDYLAKFGKVTEVKLTDPGFGPSK